MDKGSGALQVDWGVLAYGGLLSRVPACFIHYVVYVFVPVHVWMLGGQYMPQWFWQLFSLGFPVVKVKPSIILVLRPVLCPLWSNSVGDPSIQSALWFTVLQTSSSHHTSAIFTWAFLAFMRFVFQHKQRGVFCLAGVCWLVWWWQCVVTTPLCSLCLLFPSLFAVCADPPLSAQNRRVPVYTGAIGAGDETKRNKELWVFIPCF